MSWLWDFCSFSPNVSLNHYCVQWCGFSSCQLLDVYLVYVAEIQYTRIYPIPFLIRWTNVTCIYFGWQTDVILSDNTFIDFSSILQLSMTPNSLTSLNQLLSRKIAFPWTYTRRTWIQNFFCPAYRLQSAIDGSLQRTQGYTSKG